MEDYRPKVIEFDVSEDTTCMPATLGEYESAEEAIKFISSNLITVNQGITVNRHMDSFEKKEIRQEYNDILENRLPILEKEHSVATSQLNDAKKKEKDAAEMVRASENEAKILAREVKAGIKEINLDELFTFKVPYQCKHYYYTFIDKELKLCRIREIPEHEKSEIWNAMAGNETFIDDHFGDGKAEE
jgi:hypothetical protein